MKNLATLLLPALLSIMFCTEITATTISGNISYTGSSTEIISVAVFTDANLNGSPVAFAQIPAPGNYSVTELQDGVYYIISIMGISEEGEIELTDPWGVYGSIGKSDTYNNYRRNRRFRY